LKSLTDDWIRSRSGPGPFDRGVELYKDGSVLTVKISGTDILAKVQSASSKKAKPREDSQEVYMVHMKTENLQKLIVSNCGCMASQKENNPRYFCKHVIIMIIF